MGDIRNNLIKKKRSSNYKICCFEHIKIYENESFILILRKLYFACIVYMYIKNFYYNFINQKLYKKFHF